MPGLSCLKCLGRLEINGRGDQPKVCKCGYQNTFYAAHCLNDAIMKIGSRIVSDTMISFIGSILHGLDKNGPLYKVSAEGIAFEFEGDKLYSRLKLDEVEAIIAPDKIEAIGTKAVEELIEQTRHKLASLLGRYVDKIEAATIVAHLLDKETGKLAPMVVRRTSASGKDSFYIGDDLADPANRSRLYLNREQEMLFSVIGEAMYDSVKSTITKDSFLLSRVEYPLVIIYQAFDPKDSRLYVYL